MEHPLAVGLLANALFKYFLIVVFDKLHAEGLLRFPVEVDLAVEVVDLACVREDVLFGGERSHFKTSLQSIVAESHGRNVGLKEKGRKPRGDPRVQTDCLVKRKRYLYIFRRG